MHFRDAIFPAGATRRDWLVDATLAATLALAQLASGRLLGAAYVPQTPWEGLVCLAMVAALVFRRHAPLLVLALIFVSVFVSLRSSGWPTSRP